MISIFKSTVPPFEKRITVPKVAYMKDRITSSIEKAIHFYNFNPRAVSSNHLLVKLIQSINVPIALPVEQYTWEVSEIAPAVAKVFGIGSYVYPANVNRRPTFYGPGCQELIQLRTGLFEIGQDWRDVVPMQVKVHPRNDLSVALLLGSSTDESEGLAIIDLDLEALMYMYRGWQLSTALEIEESLNLSQFVATYVLPTMLKSHIDVAWFNRAMSPIMGRELMDTIPVSGLALPNLVMYGDSVTSELLNSFSKSNYRLIEMLSTFPLLNVDTLYDHTRIAFAPPTKSINAYELLLQKHYIVPLLKLEKISPGIANVSVINEMRRLLRRALTEKWLSSSGVSISELSLLSELLA